MTGGQYASLSLASSRDIKDVPIFISASAISAYRHFFSISTYAHIGYWQTFFLPILPIFEYPHFETYRQNKSLVIWNPIIWKYRQYRQSPISAHRHIDKNVILARPYKILSPDKSDNSETRDTMHGIQQTTGSPSLDLTSGWKQPDLDNDPFDRVVTQWEWSPCTKWMDCVILMTEVPGYSRTFSFRPSLTKTTVTVNTLWINALVLIQPTSPCETRAQVWVQNSSSNITYRKYVRQYNDLSLSSKTYICSKDKSGLENCINSIDKAHPQMVNG